VEEPGKPASLLPGQTQPQRRVRKRRSRIKPVDPGSGTIPGPDTPPSVTAAAYWATATRATAMLGHGSATVRRVARLTVTAVPDPPRRRRTGSPRRFRRESGRRFSGVPARTSRLAIPRFPSPAGIAICPSVATDQDGLPPLAHSRASPLNSAASAREGVGAVDGRVGLDRRVRFVSQHARSLSSWRARSGPPHQRGVRSDHHLSTETRSSLGPLPSTTLRRSRSCPSRT